MTWSNVLIQYSSHYCHLTACEDLRRCHRKDIEKINQDSFFQPQVRTKLNFEWLIQIFQFFFVSYLKLLKSIALVYSLKVD